MDEQDLQDLKSGKIVLTIPLIKYNEEASQYQILNWQDWPKLPESEDDFQYILKEIDL